MNKADTIDIAIAETLKNHPDYVEMEPTIIYGCCQSAISPQKFTRTNNARDNIRKMDSKTFIHYILNKALLIYGSMMEEFDNNRELSGMTSREKIDYLSSQYLHNEEIVKMYYQIQSNIRNGVNSILYYQDHMIELLPIVEAVIQTRFNPKWYNTWPGDATKDGENFRQRIDSDGIKSIAIQDFVEEINRDYNKVENVVNYHVYNKTRNKCVEDVLNGSQLKNKHNDYALDGTLYASQDFGNTRKNQEDSTVILNHPQNANFKMLVVADGMGGFDSGEFASSFIVTKLTKWFQSLPPTLYNEPQKMALYFKDEIVKVNNDLAFEIRKRGIGNCGSTIVGSIITQNDTITCNVGDSRAMAIKDGKMNLISHDDSVPMLELESKLAREGRENRPTMAEINDFRFHRKNNEITKYIGCNHNISNEINLSVIPNNSYDKLILTSDGITDLLSLEDIICICSNTPAQEICKQLVLSALKKNAYRPQGSDKSHKSMVEAGKDNATVAMADMAEIRRGGR